jgi:hypothetical protein
VFAWIGPEVGARIMAVVLKPSSDDRGRPPAEASAAALMRPVVGSIRKSLGKGSWLVAASARTQVVAGATGKVPTTTVSASGKP